MSTFPLLRGPVQLSRHWGFLCWPLTYPTPNFTPSHELASGPTLLPLQKIQTLEVSLSTSKVFFQTNIVSPIKEITMQAVKFRLELVLISVNNLIINSNLVFFQFLCMRKLRLRDLKSLLALTFRTVFLVFPQTTRLRITWVVCFVF